MHKSAQYCLTHPNTALSLLCATEIIVVRPHAAQMGVPSTSHSETPSVNPILKPPSPLCTACMLVVLSCFFLSGFLRVTRMHGPRGTIECFSVSDAFVLPHPAPTHLIQARVICEEVGRTPTRLGRQHPRIPHQHARPPSSPFPAASASQALVESHLPFLQQIKHTVGPHVRPSAVQDRPVGLTAAAGLGLIGGLGLFLKALPAQISQQVDGR